jgi:hypothetical protein
MGLRLPGGTARVRGVWRPSQLGLAFALVGAMGACGPSQSEPPVDEPDAAPTIDEPDAAPTVAEPDAMPPVEPPDAAVPADPCPTDVVCVTGFPFTHSDTTAGAASDVFDAYSCASATNESGHEVVYRVDVPQAGFLALTLGGMPAGVDVDVHLLASEDAADCIDRGNFAAGAFVEAGRYWVVADTWVSSTGDEKDGPYTLTLGLTSVDGLAAHGAAADFAYDALRAFEVAWVNGDTDRFQYAITDFSLPSSVPREWVLDLTDGSVTWELYVAHGEGSSTGDTLIADVFSNVDGSHQSSLGMMRGAEVFEGTYGTSMRLDGLEDGFNDAVRSRAIIVHEWEGSRPEYVDFWGETAETWGCPAIDDRITADVIDALTDGALLFFWHPTAAGWHASSAYVP